MPSIIRFLAVLIAFIVLSPHSYSQTLGNRLDRISKVRIVVEDLDGGACGVTKDGLRSAASRPFETSPLVLSEEAKIYLHVNVVIVTFDGNRCAANYRCETDPTQLASRG